MILKFTKIREGVGDFIGFDAEILRRELSAILGNSGWHLNTNENEIEVIITDPTLEVHQQAVTDAVKLHGSEAQVLQRAKNGKISDVKKMAGEKIVTRYPYYKQANINELQGYVQADKDAMWQWINAVRVASNSIESEINALTDQAAVESFDVANHTAWPV